MMMAMIDASIVIISMPAIFRGIGLDPFAAGCFSPSRWRAFPPAANPAWQAG
jgi:hypothetical protein